MPRQPDNDKLILEQAARWHLWLRDNRADPSEVDVFQRWCASSDKHRRAYEHIETLWRQCDGIDPLDLPWPTELELSLDQYDGSYALPLPGQRNPLLDDAGRLDTSAHFVLGQQPPRPARSPRRGAGMWRIAAAVAGVALLAGLLSPLALERFKSPAAERYATDVAQQTAETLADGSTVTLGGDSRLSVQFDERARRVVLERGEAFFDVAKDASRPFTVRVVDSEVRAVGTAFNINKRDQAVTVSVVEGVVDVTRSSGPAEQTAGAVQKARLERGQELVYDRSGQIWATRDQVAPERVVAWRNGRLAFVNERLDRVLQDINRYSKRRLVLGDNSLAGLRFTGTVFSADIQGWLEGLEQAFNVRSLNVDDSIVLLKQTDTGG